MDVLFGSVYEEMKKSGKKYTLTKQKTEKNAKSIRRNTNELQSRKRGKRLPTKHNTFCCFVKRCGHTNM